MSIIKSDDIIDLVRKVKVCTESGSVEDFEKIISDYNQSNIIFYDFNADRFAVDFIFCDLAVTYIQRFPAEFIRKDRADFFTTPLKYLLIKSISNRDEFAFKIADVLFKSSAKNIFIPMILSYSVCSKWYEFLLYCLERIEKPWLYIGNKEIYDVLVLVNEERYELLDALFSDITEDELFKMLGLILINHDEYFGKTGIECFCELADRYGTAVCGGKDRIAAVLEKQEWMLMNVNANLVSDYYIRSWEYMREKGIRLHNVTDLIYFVPECHENETDNIELLKQYVKPLFADDVYIDIFMLRGENVSEFLHILDEIGEVRDRVYIDLTDKTFPALSDYAKERDFRNKLGGLIKEGFPLRTEENFAESNAAISLINIPRTLEIVLRNGDFSEEQLTELAGMCTIEKKYSALNVVRRILDDRASSNLKKKPRKDDV